MCKYLPETFCNHLLLADHTIVFWISSICKYSRNTFFRPPSRGKVSQQCSAGAQESLLGATSRVGWKWKICTDENAKEHPQWHWTPTGRSGVCTCSALYWGLDCKGIGSFCTNLLDMCLLFIGRQMFAGGDKRNYLTLKQLNYCRIVLNSCAN